jgi:hypothetical protein
LWVGVDEQGACSHSKPSGQVPLSLFSPSLP